MKLKIQHFYFKELFVLFIGHVFYKILQKFNYEKKYLPLKEEINSLLEENFEIRRKDNSLLLRKPGCCGDKKILIRPSTSDRFVLRQVVIENEYLPIINLIKDKSAINSIRLIVDAGANIGLTTMFFNSYFTDAKIIAVEPEESNFEQLLKNIKINKLNDRVIPIKKALWINNTEQLSINNEFRDRRHWAKAVLPSNLDGECVLPITLMKIINLYAKNQNIDILKIDVEGTEALLFKSDEFLDTLVEHVSFLCFEIHKEFMSRDLFHGILNDINFEFIDIGETTFCFNKSMLKNKAHY